jgi:hypothetical protein
MKSKGDNFCNRINSMLFQDFKGKEMRKTGTFVVFHNISGKKIILLDIFQIRSPQSKGSSYYKLKEKKFIKLELIYHNFRDYRPSLLLDIFSQFLLPTKQRLSIPDSN